MSWKKDHRRPTEPKSTDKDRAERPEDRPAEQPAPSDDAGDAPELEVPRVEDLLDEDDQQLAELSELQAELEDAKDRALRFMAEMENYKKRVARQVEEERRYANLPLIRDLLPALDNMNRAIEAAEKSDSASGLLEGVKMVVQQIHGVLAQHDCHPIDAQDQPFDPNHHAAISQQPTADVPPGTVLHVVQTGFRLHDRVVRPSHVIVSAPAAEEETEDAEGEGAGD
ncbi:MAG: nucleotide exchange factor GrpE [Pirellulales bacterium]|nr:nucleotide exchange factor GrpE [Pirellulales bacterium]